MMMVVLTGCATQPMPSTTPVIKAPVVDPTPRQDLLLPLSTGQREGPGETYFDPHHTGVPLFDLKGRANMKLSPWFRAKDFARSGHTTPRYARIDKRLVACLTRVRDATGHTMSILSGYRSFAHNQNIRRAGEGAAKSSYHISGSAADVVTSTPVEQFAIAVYLECGCNAGFGVSPRFYHVDLRNHPVTPWGYAASAAPRLAIARKVQRNVCGN